MGLVKLLREVKSVWNNRQNVGMGEIQSGMTTEDSRGKQKLVSGKCVKPDEMDIKVVVKYAHEKLDPKYIQDQTFDSLPFNLLVAGELELASCPEITLEERLSRLKIAKVICYHKQYLTDADLMSRRQSNSKEG